MYEIGRVFTPLYWAEWLIEKSGAFEAWMAGATICDPTAGTGAFLEAFITLAKKAGRTIRHDDILRLHGIEIEPADKPEIIQRLRVKYGVELPPSNLIVGDILSPDVRASYDFVVGNPPWVNFSVIPSELRDEWSQSFLRLGLVTSKKDVLLGSSRADITTAIIKKVVDENLAEKGTAAFFIPLSVLFNSGANDRFRPYPGSNHTFSVSEVWDFEDEPVFDGVATRYGAVLIRKSEAQRFPVPTNVRKSGEWGQFFSSPTDGRSGFWHRHGLDALAIRERPALAKDQRPRQGVNTCGANDVLIFTKEGDTFVSGAGERTQLEDALMFPLLHGEIFGRTRRRAGPAQKFVLLAHDQSTGRPLTSLDLEEFPLTRDYLFRHRDRLEQRKGIMLQSLMKRGAWWSLLGVGPYSFARWKVAWEALGRSDFNPIVVPGNWQGNQALHAFCPCFSEEEANSLCEVLRSPSVEQALRASAMGGTMNWAQPGRVSKILQLI